VKNLLSSLAVTAVGFTSPAFSADMPVKAPPPPAPVVSIWTGPYFGVNGGWNWGRSNGSTTELSTPLGYIPSYVVAINALGAGQNFDTSGFTGGVTAGYNWQTGYWVLGFETDFEYFRSAGSKTVTGPAPGPADTLTITSSVSTDWLFTARPRVGVTTGNWLWYGTGGLAVTNLKGNWSFFNPAFGANFTESASASTTRAGWAAGGGVETAFPGRWSLGVEYLYVKFNGVSGSGLVVTPLGPIPPVNLFNHSADLTSNIIRARLNKQF
jgi:outer membrane immunogenic protein